MNLRTPIRSPQPLGDNSVWRNAMREPGLEPGSLSTPDPKSQDAPEPTPAAEPKLAPGATEIPPDSAPGTTQSTTRDIDGSGYCDRCGRLCGGPLTTGTSEELIVLKDGTIICAECDDEDSAE